MAKRKPRWNETRSEPSFLTRCFADGLSGAYGRRVWSTVLSVSRLRSQRKLARKLSVHHSLVNRGINHGELDLNALLLLLTDLELSPGDLPEVPRLQYMALKGYLAACEGLTGNAIAVRDLIVCLVAGRLPQFAVLVWSLRTGKVDANERSTANAIASLEGRISEASSQLEVMYYEQERQQSGRSRKHRDTSTPTVWTFEKIEATVRKHGMQVDTVVTSIEKFLRVTQSVGSEGDSGQESTP